MNQTRDAIINRYRPNSFDMVLGQKSTVNSLKHFSEAGKWPHALLFHGPTGCGKTTLARLVAQEVGCEKHNLIEIDAATFGGVDSMRSLQQGLQLGGFGRSTVKCVVVDEAHAMSPQSWTSLLKSIEEPPSHVYFIFCTTEFSKVPKNIRTRVAAYQLSAVSIGDIVQLLDDVSVLEEIKLPPKGALIIAEACQGSPRQALVFLAQAAGVQSEADLRKLVQATAPPTSFEDVKKILLSNDITWKAVQPCLKALKEEENPESMRIAIRRYLSAVILNTKDSQRAGMLLERLDAFSDPCPPSDGWAPLMASFARLIWR